MASIFGCPGSGSSRNKERERQNIGGGSSGSILAQGGVEAA